MEQNAAQKKNYDNVIQLLSFEKAKNNVFPTVKLIRNKEWCGEREIGL